MVLTNSVVSMKGRREGTSMVFHYMHTVLEPKVGGGNLSDLGGYKVVYKKKRGILLASQLNKFHSYAAHKQIPLRVYSLYIQFP